MKNKLPLIARILFGLGFFVFGLNGFLNFFPIPPMPEKAQAFMGGLAASGYFFPVLKGTETLCGLLLLSGYYVPLVLVVLAPITLQILLFHTMLEPGGIPVAVVFIALHLYLAWTRRAAYAPLLQAK